MQKGCVYNVVHCFSSWRLSFFVCLALLWSSGGKAEALSLHYQRIEGLSGTLNSVGSDTLASMMAYWAGDFRQLYPNMNVQVQAAGSSTAPTALIEGTADFGPMSRPMKTQEINAFIDRYGYPPTAIRIGIDAMAIFVNRDNPLPGLSVRQIDAIFSANRRCGALHAITRWGQLGLTEWWQQRTIQLFGRNSVSGTYGYFKSQALCHGDFKRTVNEQPGSASVVQAVSASPTAIGYSGIGYRTSGVRALPITIDGEHFIAPTMANAANGEYPLARYLFIYINKAPNQPLAPNVREFMRFVLSVEGQSVVKKDGYVPLPPALIKQQRQRLQ